MLFSSVSLLRCELVDKLTASDRSISLCILHSMQSADDKTANECLICSSLSWLGKKTVEWRNVDWCNSCEWARCFVFTFDCQTFFQYFASNFVSDSFLSYEKIKCKIFMFSLQHFKPNMLNSTIDFECAHSTCLTSKLSNRWSPTKTGLLQLYNTNVQSNSLRNHAAKTQWYRTSAATAEITQ